MRYHLDMGKRRQEYTISFIIAKDYFSFPAFTSANSKKYKGFQWAKATVKVSLQITAMNCHMFCKLCLVILWSSKVHVSISYLSEKLVTLIVHIVKLLKLIKRICLSV